MSYDDPIDLASSDEEEQPRSSSARVESEQKHIDSADNDAGELVAEGIRVIKGTAPAGRRKDPFHNKQYRWWFFTWNNPSHPEDKEILLESSIVSYVKFQLEKGKEGTLHYQGVLYCKSATRCTTLLKAFVGCGYFAPVINSEAAVRYCGKLESRVDGPWTAGKLPKQGERSDLLECKSIIDNGGRMDDVFEQQFSNAVRYGRGLREYCAIKNRNNVRKWQTISYIYTGDAGTGKTQAAMIEAAAWGGGTYWLTVERTGGKLWWDGYEGQENIIIDEFNCGISLTDFKRIIDSSPLTIPIKGGMVQFLGKRIWICSNNPLDVWYYKAAPPGPNRNAFNRRIHYHERFDIKFQGAPGFEEYQETREWFVDLQKSGQIKISPD